MKLDAGKEELLERLATIAARHGAERLIRAPFVLPTAACFPEAYAPSILGMATLVHRLLRYAGVTLPFEVDDEREPLDSADLLLHATREPRVAFFGVEEDKLVFEITQLGPPDLTVAALCHEVSYALLVAGRPNQPPPIPPDAIDAAIATIYCGFGLLTIPAARAFRKATELRGSYEHSRTAHIHIGGLGTGELVFLQALLCVLREHGDLDPVRAQLDAEQRADFERWCATLLPDADALRRRLGVPMLSTIDRELKLPEVPPLDERVRAECAAKDAAYAQPMAGKVVDRLWETNRAIWAMLIGMVGFVPMLLMLNHPQTSSFCVLPMALCAFVGAKIGANKRAYYCGACRMRLRTTETTCPKCGASFGRDRPVPVHPSDMED